MYYAYCDKFNKINCIKIWNVMAPVEVDLISPITPASDKKMVMCLLCYITRYAILKQSLLRTLIPKQWFKQFRSLHSGRNTREGIK